MDDFNHFIGSDYATSEFQMPNTLNSSDINIQQHHIQQLAEMQNIQLQNTLLEPNNTQSGLDPFEHPSGTSLNLMSDDGHIAAAPIDTGALHATEVNELSTVQATDESANPNVSININENPADVNVAPGEEENSTHNENNAQEAETDKGNADNGDEQTPNADGTGNTGDKDEGDKDDGEKEHGENNEEDDEEEEDEEDETEAKEELDKNQCRICLSKDNLLSIFKVSNRYDFRVSDLIMKICTTIKIGERDYLPHYVCANCEERIESAYGLRLQCEESEKLLRSKLKRSKKTRRNPSQFVIIDAEPSSDSNDENQDDDEFHLSEVSEEDSEVDSDMSYEEKKKRPPARRTRRAPPQKSVAQKRKAPPVAQRSSRKAGVVYIDAAGSDDDNGQTRKRTKPNRVTQVFKCASCNRICGSAEQLQAHMQVHVSEKCRYCGKEFRHRPTLMLHYQKHNEGRICATCHLEFATKNDCRRHMQMAHTVTHNCNMCKRSFPSKGRLDGHKCEGIVSGRSRMPPGPEQPSTGRDLFKSVAPPTTTYWSDSFSD